MKKQKANVTLNFKLRNKDYAATPWKKLSGMSIVRIIEFSGKSKTDFALDLVYECDDYTIPAYIKSGLKWLNEQKILE